jgi:apolipoprotein N-acyltransferase
MLRQVKSPVTSHQSPVNKIKFLFFVILSAILLALPFASGKLWILAWVGFVPLFLACKNTSKIRAFLLFYLTGIIFWFGVIYWLIHVTLAGLVVLVLYLALYFGLFGLIFSYCELQATCLAGRQASYGLLFISSAWVLLEYIRSHLFTGFPWALLGYSQCLNLPAIQIADITGAWGVSFLVMMANVAVYSVVRRPCLYGRQASSVVRDKSRYVFCLLYLLASLSYGFLKLHGIRNTEYGIRVSVIQPNIPQELKWNENAKDYILDKYARLTKDAVSQAPDLIIWPEASIPGILGEDNSVFEQVFALVRNVKAPLLAGAVIRDNESYFNSALLISVSGEIIGRYDKLHLVPFGEYIPLKKIFPFLETVVPIGDITAGREYTLFRIHSSESGVRSSFGVLNCFEDLFPGLSRGFVRRGADFLVNITNDAWYKQTSAPYQHLQASVFRAVENRVFLARCANTGISGFIWPDGKLSLVSNETGKNIFVDGYKTLSIPTAKKDLSFYSRFGDIFIVLLFIFVFYGIFRFAGVKKAE